MKILLVGLAVLLFHSCGATRDITKEYGPNAFVLKGIMTRVSIEGGCWQFKGDDGTIYQISGEHLKLLQKESQRAEIIVRNMPNSRTICMAGKTVELIKIIKTY